MFLAGENVSSALLKNKEYIETPIEGELTFGVFIMEASSELRFAKHMKLDTSTLYMRQKAIISADTIHMYLNEGHLEGSSHISSSRKGPRAQQGLGPGSNSVGSGAGHGGQGAPSTTVLGGSGYGSYVYPVHPGSGGGGRNGGAGGSTTEVKVTNDLKIPGTGALFIVSYLG